MKVDKDLITMKRMPCGDSLNIDKAREEESKTTARVLCVGNQKTKVQGGTLLFECQERMEGRSMC